MKHPVIGIIRNVSRRQAHARANARELDDLGTLMFATVITLFFSALTFLMDTDDTTKEVKVKMYAYDLRLSNYKVNVRDVVFISVYMPDGERRVFNTEQRAGKCPFIDTKTPIVLVEKVGIHRMMGWEMSRNYELKYHPCKMKNKL